ncbi:histidine kinase [Streptomyces sp. NBC_01604]|uniref:sensor histidine kinase n=1 Tax=Streptomyces sp. NBC_01604 TaxID=2975894 RepID=UPI00386B2765
MEYDLPFSARAQRLITIGVGAVFVLVWLLDLTHLVYGPTVIDSPTVWLTTLGSGPLAAAALVRADRSPALMWRAGVAAVLSTVLTVWAPAIPYRQGPASWGLLETAGLLGLITFTVRGVARPGAAFGLGAALGVSMILQPLRVDGDPRTLGSCFVLFIFVVGGTSLGAYLRLLQARRARAIVEVRHGERLELARDLHDYIAHHVTGMIVQANAALAVHQTAPDKVEPILKNIARSGSETLASMRRLIHVLREEERGGPRPGELMTELGRLVSDFSATAMEDATASAKGTGPTRAGQARLDVSAAARAVRLPPEVETSVHRMVQETLTNVRRHAPGAEVTVRLDADHAWLRVTTLNTAPTRRGAPPTGGRGGVGLVGLHERIEAVDGTLTAGPALGGGWQTTAVFPLTADDQKAATPTPAEYLPAKGT